MNQSAHHNIIDLLLKSAANNPSKTALVQGDQSLSYSELIAEVKRYVNHFHLKGLKKGDRVLVFVPMTIDLYAIVLALFYCGMTPVFIDEWAGMKRLALCCETVPCQGIITKRKFLLFVYLVPGIRRIPIRMSTSKGTIQSSIEPEAVSLTGTALITFTTGSTGIPKAANRTHEFLFAQFHALKTLLLNQGNVVLNTLPIVTLLNIGCSKTTVLPPVGFKAKHALSLRRILAEQKSIDSIITSPSIAFALAEAGVPSSHIRHMITGGGPVTPAQAITIKKHFSQADITVVYGSTEAEPISHIKIEELAAVSSNVIKEKGLPVGRPEKIGIQVIGFCDQPIYSQTAETFRLLKVEDGNAGEIVVSGPHVLKEYINNPYAIATNKINVDGTIWHRTGDLGRIDEAGNLYFLGRCNEMIQWKGKPVFPLIISILLHQKTGVKESALLSHEGNLVLVTEKTYGDKSEEIESALKDFGIEHSSVQFIPKLPRDPRHHTKIDYEKLRRML